MHYYVDVFKKYATFSGRARRKEFWMFLLFNIIVAIILGIIDGVLNMKVLSTLYGLAIIIPSLAVTVRRLHDTGRSGWWIFISLIPIIGTIIILIFEIMDSQAGDNKYGPNPKGMMAQNATPAMPQ